jgi:hypothetical protein
MLYIGGGTFFTGPDGKILPVYSLRWTYSSDGVFWDEPSEELLVPDQSAGEIGFGRPFIWHDFIGRAALLLSIRKLAGYALTELFQSPAGLTRRPLFDRSTSGWDRDMTCFGAPCRTPDQKSELLFYNGNQFGRTGFGVARRASATQDGGEIVSIVEALRRDRNLRQSAFQ